MRTVLVLLPLLLPACSLLFSNPSADDGDSGSGTIDGAPGAFDSAPGQPVHDSAPQDDAPSALDAGGCPVPAPGSDAFFCSASSSCDEATCCVYERKSDVALSCNAICAALSPPMTCFAAFQPQKQSDLCAMSTPILCVDSEPNRVCLCER